jgi:hypothetical protein
LGDPRHDLTQKFPCCEGSLIQYEFDQNTMSLNTFNKVNKRLKIAALGLSILAALLQF